VTALVERQWKNVGLMWLVMIGIRIVWAIALFILILPLLIVSILTAVGGLLVAIVPTLVTAGIASLLSAPAYWPWIFALVVGLPFFFIVTFSPIFLVHGWGQIYQSSVWTLTYRELKALESVTPATTEGPKPEAVQK
jgi:predicted membrane metal-binding protein